MNSRHTWWADLFASPLLGLCLALLSAAPARAQVSPAEIANPRLKAAEESYLPHLQSLHHLINEMKFPLPFVLTRYVGRDPARQAPLDTRGLEFVYFQDRMLLKTSGFYSAAFNSDQLTQNERASRTFQEVVVPIIRTIAQDFPPDQVCEGLGFEIAYHVRPRGRNSDFEGREILAVVLDRGEALAFLKEPANDKLQDILNRSEVYVDGKPFGLALGAKQPLSLETLGKEDTLQPVSARASARTRADANAGLPLTNSRPSSGDTSVPAYPVRAEKAAAADLKPAATQADADRVQAQYQSQLDALPGEVGARLHLVEYAPPSIALYHKQLVLQLTLRDPLRFDTNAGSIYKRAAQTFDLFLASQLKVLVPKLPSNMTIDGLDFSILNRLGDEKDPSEAIEFICPLKSVQAFVDDELTSQDLVNQSVVLVNGVRIELHLEKVE